MFLHDDRLVCEISTVGSLALRLRHTCMYSRLDGRCTAWFQSQTISTDWLTFRACLSQAYCKKCKAVVCIKILCNVI